MGNVTLSSPVSWFRRCVPSALIHIHSYDGADLLIRCLANRENNVRPLHSLTTLSCNLRGLSEWLAIRSNIRYPRNSLRSRISRYSLYPLTICTLNRLSCSCVDEKFPFISTACGTSALTENWHLENTQFYLVRNPRYLGTWCSYLPASNWSRRNPDSNCSRTYLMKNPSRCLLLGFFLIPFDELDLLKTLFPEARSQVIPVSSISRPRSKHV